ncbi:MAG: Mg/Co/Ni transporter MgtE [Bradymonadia bacterium]|jgi:Mg/Co/Ni transporter MgtE
MTAEPIRADEHRPWLVLAQLASGGDSASLAAFVDSLPSGEAARALAHLDEAELRAVFTTLDACDAAAFLEQLSLAQAVDAME